MTDNHTPPPASLGGHALALVLLVAITLCGCATTRTEAEDAGELLGLTPAVDNSYIRHEQWWQILGDNSLNTLMQAGLAANADLAKAGISVNRALYEANRLGADLLPAFSAQGRSSATHYNEASRPTMRTTSADFSVNFEVDLWLKMVKKASAAQWEYQATVEDREAVRLTLTANIADAYFELLYLEKSIDAAKQNIENYKKIRAIMAARFQHGKGLQEDADQAAIALVQAEKDLTDLLGQQKETRTLMANLLQRRPDAQQFGLAPGFPRADQSRVNLEVPFAVLANRPDIRAAQYRLQSAFKNIQAAERAWFPTISLSAALSYAAETASSLFSAPSTTRAVAVSLPFLQWNTIYWNVKMSEADYDTRRIDYESALTTALNEVDAALYQYRLAHTSLGYARTVFQGKKKIADLYRAQYENGKREARDWLQTVNESTSAQRSLFQAEYLALHQEVLVYKVLAGRYEAKKVILPTGTSIPAP